jgi:hypothetical protein
METVQNFIEIFDEICQDFFNNIFELFFWWTQQINRSNDLELFLEGRNCLEIFFFIIVDSIRTIFNSKIDRRKEGFFDNFIIDTSIIFFIFLIPITLFISFQTSSPEFNQLFQYFVFIMFLAVLWTGYIYINEQFRRLIYAKFLPILNRFNLRNKIYFRLLDPFFNGILIMENGTRFYLRSVFIIGFTTLISTIIAIMALPSISNFQQFFLICYNLFLVTLLFIVTGYVIVTIFGILLYLALAVRRLPIHINPLLDRAGTEIFGNFTINCLYLTSIAIGFFPFLYIYRDFSSNFPKLTEISHQPFGNLTNTTRDVIIHSVNNASINSIWSYLVYFIIFFIFIFLALIIIVSLHYRIKKRKLEELRRIENLLLAIDVSQLDEDTITEKKKNLLFIYEKILSLHDWPTKNITILGLFLSLLPILISYILSK